MSTENSEELISLLRKTIDKDDESKMNAVVARIPLLCKSVLDLHEGQLEIKEAVKEVSTAVKNIAISMSQMQNTKDADVKYVGKDGKYSVVENLVFGMAGIILTAVITALVYLVINK